MASSETIRLGSVVVADTFLTRLVGLMGKPIPGWGEGLLLVPCSDIHMWGMRFPIDALFLDERGVVVSLAEELKPNRGWARHRGAHQVLEVRAGTVKKLGIKVGDTIVWGTEET